MGANIAAFVVDEALLAKFDHHSGDDFAGGADEFGEFLVREADARLVDAGGIGGKGLWRPVELGIRPRNESDAMKRYLEGQYIGARK